MIPVGDSARARSFPWVNLSIILLNFLVFFYELNLNAQAVSFGVTELDRFIRNWGSTPACVNTVLGLDVVISRDRLAEYRAICDQGDVHTLATLVTSMFLHAGWPHILGNMLFLWIFGDNVEDRMGHLGYALFYTLVGLFAGLAHAFMNVNDLIPSVGASGAISGVMAAYLVLFPRAMIRIVLPFAFFWIAEVPAWALIGSWFLLQLINGYAALAETAQSGGIAWFAHIGGFVAGLVLVWVFKREARGPAYRPPPEPPDLFDFP
jgi:membrane associated rhomboid family serine protease